MGAVVLTRRPGGSLLIDGPGAVERIQIAVLGMKGNQVRIGTESLILQFGIEFSCPFPLPAILIL
jgi:hypothetical protein